MKVVYVGPHDEVEVPSLNLVCGRNQEVTVSDEDGNALIQQEHWDAVLTELQKKEKAAAEKKAAAAAEAAKAKDES